MTPIHCLMAILWFESLIHLGFAQIVTVFAGSGAASSIDGQGTSATFQVPTAIKIDDAGNLYVVDQNNHKIRKITQSGVVTTIAGSGVASSLDGQGTLATFQNPCDLVLDSQGNIFIAGYNGHNIRKINASGYVSTIAGSGTASSLDGQGLLATFNTPTGIAIDSNATLFVTEISGRKVRKISKDGYVSTVAGTGAAGYGDGSATSATFTEVRGIAIDRPGNIILSDGLKIRSISPNGQVSTIAGSTSGTANGQGVAGLFILTAFLTIGIDGRIVVADQGSNKIRMISSSFYVTDFPGTATAGLNFPHAIAFDPFGAMFIADTRNNRILKLPCQSTCASGFMAPASAGCTCVPCPIGTFQSKSAQTYCETCPSNSKCNSTSFVCNSGFGMNLNGNACVACGGVNYKSTSSNEPCTACPTGATCNSISFTCNAGLGINSNGNACIACGGVNYKSTSSNEPCTACPTGATCSNTSFTCNAGFGLNSNEDGCVPCGGDSFKQSHGNIPCLSCPLMAECTSTDFSCNAGYMQSALACAKCPSGTFKNKTGNSMCIPCPEGAYQGQTGQLECLPCPTNATCPSGSSQFICNEGLIASLTKGSCIPKTGQKSSTSIYSLQTSKTKPPLNGWAQLWSSNPTAGLLIIFASWLLWFAIGFVFGFLKQFAAGKYSNADCKVNKTNHRTVFAESHFKERYQTVSGKRR